MDLDRFFFLKKAHKIVNTWVQKSNFLPMNPNPLQNIRKMYIITCCLGPDDSKNTHFTHSIDSVKCRFATLVFLLRLFTLYHHKYDAIMSYLSIKTGQSFPQYHSLIILNIWHSLLFCRTHSRIIDEKDIKR